ncbi:MULTISPECIES: glycosyltransferase family 2 protein [Cyanobium]|uniref:Glycosyl transferase n=1 Tax=Cyanobium usitatum str. Tous TaxID=2116684 RepID=A0A2P7MQQ1_9CYAN|nr:MULTISPECIES: glycosyltransferase family 2 protein [Cyanobium]MCP9781603.1 glycosyltransferase [Cyanobium sp. To12R1]PSJ03550.1 glycosyl transferase [Cyanobium usitatum str. Tous]
MLSLSMIVRNEAERLERCLASVAGFVDEMVLLDTGSSDATIAIAESCGAVVHQLPWPGDFAPARNEALGHVKGDWVLVLDADEWLLPEARQPLQALMAEPDLLLINLLRQELGAAQSPYSNVSRLFRRHPAIHWSRPYHSMVDDSVLALLEKEPHWQLADCAVPALAHDGYRSDLLASGAKAERLRQAMEADLAANPGDPYACAKLGSLEVSEGSRERGIALLQQGLARCPASRHPERYELLLHLAIALGSSDPKHACQLYRQALELPLPPRLTLAARLNLAALLQEPGTTSQGALEEACELCRQACAAAPELALGWLHLGISERRRGQLPAAIAAYRSGLERDPSLAAAQQNLAVALLLSGDVRGARSGFRQAIALLEQQNQQSEAEALRQQAGSMVKLDDQ